MDPMVNGLIMVWGIILGVSIILGFDWYGRRKERQSKHPPKS